MAAGALRALHDEQHFGGQLTHAEHVLCAVPMQELGRRVRTCAWVKSELPGSPALDALQLWGAMLANTRWR